MVYALKIYFDFGGFSMKKGLLFLIFVFTAGFFISCSQDKTEIGWINGSSKSIRDVRWLDENDQTNQSWTGDYAVQSQTSQKSISKNTGHAECLADVGGGNFTDHKIQFNGSTNQTIPEGSHMYTVQQVTAK